ncbi:MAG: hypothetical protein ACLP3C_11535 [Mycobacterium sp.]
MDIEDATRHQERFEPQVVNEHQRRLSGIDEMLLALPAKGLTTGEVAADFADVYDYLGARRARRCRQTRRRTQIRPDRAQEAKDTVRAFGMRLLPVDDPHVKSDLAKIEKAQSSFRRSCSSGATSPPRTWNSRPTSAATRLSRPSFCLMPPTITSCRCGQRIFD